MPDIAVFDWLRYSVAQYGSVKARDAINRRLYNNQSFVETAIYRVFALRLGNLSRLRFAISGVSSKNLIRIHQ